MDFPIIELLDEQASKDWLEEHFHPEGMRCPQCGASRDAARAFRQTRESKLVVYRCYECDGVYNLYSGTLFEGSRLRAEQVVLLLRGVLKGQPSSEIAREVGVSKPTVLLWRHRLQAQAAEQQPQTPLPDSEAEVDEVFQNAGEKRCRA